MLVLGSVICLEIHRLAHVTLHVFFRVSSAVRVVRKKRVAALRCAASDGRNFRGPTGERHRAQPGSSPTFPYTDFVVPLQVRYDWTL